MATTIKLKSGSGAPLAGDLVAAEPAFDLTNKRLYTEDSGGTVIEVGTNPGTDVTFADNRKAIFGAGSDLEIYHNGSHSIIADAGTGHLKLLAADLRINNAADTETFIAAYENSKVDIYYDNSVKLSTTATGIDVTGTATMDGLAVEGTFASPLATFNSTSGFSRIALQENGVARMYMQSLNGADGFKFMDGDGTSERMRIDSNGQTMLSGSTAAFDNTGAVDGLQFHYTTTTGKGVIGTYSSGGSTSLAFRTNSGGAGAATDHMIIDSSGQVGIGTTSPARLLHLESASPAIRIKDTSGTGTIHELITTGTNGNLLNLLLDAGGAGTSPAFIIKNVGTELMRIDSSGNLLVGKDVANSSVAGVQLLPEGDVGVTRDGSHALLLNRLTSDGDIALFRKDGTTVGSIGTSGGTTYIGGYQNAGLYFNGTTDFRPWNTSTQANLDNSVDLGSSSARFDDIYATNGTIQTSDANEKQDIEALSEAETRVAVAAKGLLRKFRWRSAVEEKGDEARVHFGIIAQDLQAAFEAEGLDAGDYAMFIHSTWTDEETGEERSRMGVRYSELLAFIIAAI